MVVIKSKGAFKGHCILGSRNLSTAFKLIMEQLVPVSIKSLASNPSIFPST